ncbi:MAG: tRNA 2-selenouridine(34) synthase MnmH [Candidatus Nitrotoga sp.]
MKHPEFITAAQLADFTCLIDVRSPSEYAEDHIPGASNYPVLNDTERERVGTLHKYSPFEAKKLGATLIARNIAHHLEQSWQNQPRNWQPLIYCARGGQRSSSLTHVLRQIGFAAARLEGGYKNYRQYVLQQLAIVPYQLPLYVLCGLTGSGKSRLLNALTHHGAQVLDMEQIARHRGSVLGDVVHEHQPGQKSFDSQLLVQLKSFDLTRPVFIESESKKIGAVRVPDKLIEKMWTSPCLRLETPIKLRIELLRGDYTHFLQRPALLHTLLLRLRGSHSNAQITHWQSLCETQAWDALITELLEQHYDPAYNKSIHHHYPNYSDAPRLVLDNPSDSGFNQLARETLTLIDKIANQGKITPTPHRR